MKSSGKHRTAPLIVERVVKISKSNDDWSIRFWQKVGVNMRFSVAWEMIKDYEKLRGKSGTKFRLQRSVENIQQI